MRFQAAFGIGDAASKKIDEDDEENKKLLGDGVGRFFVFHFSFFVVKRSNDNVFSHIERSHKP